MIVELLLWKCIKMSQYSQTALMMDLWRWHGRSNFFLLLSTLLLDRAFRTIFFYRLCKWAKNNTGARYFIYPFLRIFHRLAQGDIGFELPVSCEIGPGLRVYHGWCLVINNRVKIGSNVTLLHGVTIGGTRKGSPELEDDVTVATGAIILGPVVIGKGAIIGAGAVVTKNVEPYSVIVGNPQVCIRRNDEVNISNKAPVCFQR